MMAGMLLVIVFRGQKSHSMGIMSASPGRISCFVNKNLLRNNFCCEIEIKIFFSHCVINREQREYQCRLHSSEIS